MRDLLEKQFFPFVIRPGRYAGGEPGQIVKEPGDRVRFLYCFPDKYEIGQSYVGLQSLYHIVNRDDRFLCERAFAVDIDAEELMRSEGIPLFSLESSRPAAEFDVIGFTIPYELVYTNLLNMLDLAGIPIRSADRSDEQPLVFAGGPAVYNPEPLAPFVDLFFIGDAEDGLPQMLGLLAELGAVSREEKLRAIVEQVESVYVPSLYDDRHQPLSDSAPTEIAARVIPKLEASSYPSQPLVPLVETVHSHLAVEIMRGCPQGCRFCQAGPMYRPVRLRKPAEIMAQIETQVASSGFHEVALVSLSSSDYPHIDDLIRSASRRLRQQRISISLPSLRPDTITPELLDAVSSIRRSGLTLAPETGTERLRQFIRKNVSDESIYEAIRLAFDRGWTTIKLYFMVGLPTETDDDLLGIAEMVRNCWEIGRGRPGKRTINVTLSPFVPKAHTPFQWDAQCDVEETLRKVNFVRRNCQVRGVNFKHHNVETSILAGLMGRGGREMAAVLQAAWEAGCRFDGWSENLLTQVWFDALERHGIDVESRLHPIPFGSRLPWSHIRKGVSEAHLQRERERSSEQLREMSRPPKRDEAALDTDSSQASFGRRPKKIAGRITSSAPTRNRMRVRWGKDRRCRYMSHLENMTVIERMVRRAKIPVAFSQGFNPSMKLSFGPPLPLGFTSEAEFVDIILEDNLLPGMADSLRQVVIEGFQLHDIGVVMGKKKSLSSLLNRVVYTVPLDYHPQTERCPEQLEQLMQAACLEVERVGKSETKVVDIRPGIYDLSVDGDELTMVLGIGEGGYVRPTEIAARLITEDPRQILGWPFHRKDAYRQEDNGRVISAMEL